MLNKDNVGFVVGCEAKALRLLFDRDVGATGRIDVDINRLLRLRVGVERFETPSFVPSRLLHCLCASESRPL